MKDFISSFLVEGQLTRNDQLLLLLGLFSARRDEEKLLAIAHLAAEEGLALEEIADMISSAIISRGIPTWLSGIEVLNIVANNQLQSRLNSPINSEVFQTVEQCIYYYKTEFNEVPVWVNYLFTYAPTILLHYSNLRTVALADAKVSRLMKELLLYAINVCDVYSKGIAIHKTNAIQLGATEKLLREVRTLCVLAVGIGALNEPK